MNGDFYDDAWDDPQENFLYNDIEASVNDILEGRASKEQIDELTNSVSLIIEEEAKKIINSDFRRNTTPFKKNFNYTPSINLIICSAPPNKGYFPNQMPVYPTQATYYPYNVNFNPTNPMTMNPHQINQIPMNSAPMNPMPMNSVPMNQIPMNQTQMNYMPPNQNQEIKKKDKSEKKKESKNKKPKKISIEHFNELSLKKQKSTISSYVSGKKFKNSIKLLNYLTKLKGISKTTHYFEVRSETPTDKINNNPELKRIFLTYNLTEVIFNENSAEVSKLSQLLKPFEEVAIEIKYPSPSFDRIYSSVLHDFKPVISNLKIAIFISGISRTDGKFFGNKNINEVKFDQTVKEIKYEGSRGTFQCCSNLQKVTIPSSVTEIGNFSFQFCSSLNHVTIPSSVRLLGLHAFEGCTSLTDVKLPYPRPRMESEVFIRCPFRL